MNFVMFNVSLLLASFPAAIVFSLGVVACLAPLALAGKSEDPPKALVYAVMGLAGGFQIYFWGLWSAICVAVTLRFTAKPAVSWDWLYWVAAFGWCTALIGWFAHKERQASTDDDTPQQQGGVVMYSLVAIGAFIVFAISPRLTLPVYGWLLGSLGLAKHVGG